MKAIVYTTYGSPDVLKLEEIPQPSPADNQVLVKIHAASVNAFDWHMLRGDPFLVRFMAGLFKPKNTILGADISGTVEAVGGGASRFRPGDEVFGDVSAQGGGFAEYVCANENLLALKPSDLPHRDAAAAPLAAVTALQGLRDKGGIQGGQEVLINDASGGVGTFAVQIAKSFGAEVTAVCSTSKVDMVRAIGADHVIDYTKEDFTEGDKRFDLILGANGYHPVWHYRRALKPEGTFVLSGGTTAQFYQFILTGPLLSLTGSKKLRNYVAQPNQKDLAFVAELLAAEIIKPVIDRTYPLREVPDAIRYLEAGHARGKVVISMDT